MKSIWDGWTNQAFGERSDWGGGNCALGWLDSSRDACDAEFKYAADIERVGRYIQANYPDVCDLVNCRNYYRPEESNSLHRSSHYNPWANVVAIANNALGLTPEDFRRIDRETQIAEGMPAVEALVNSVELPVTK